METSKPKLRRFRLPRLEKLVQVVNGVEHYYFPFLQDDDNVIDTELLKLLLKYRPYGQPCRDGLKRKDSWDAFLWICHNHVDSNGKKCLYRIALCTVQKRFKQYLQVHEKLNHKSKSISHVPQLMNINLVDAIQRLVHDVKKQESLIAENEKKRKKSNTVVLVKPKVAKVNEVVDRRAASLATVRRILTYDENDHMSELSKDSDDDIDDDDSDDESGTTDIATEVTASSSEEDEESEDDESDDNASSTTDNNESTEQQLRSAKRRRLESQATALETFMKEMERQRQESRQRHQEHRKWLKDHYAERRKEHEEWVRKIKEILANLESMVKKAYS